MNQNPKISGAARREARREFERSCKVVSSEEFKKALAAVKKKINRKSVKL